MFWSHFSPANVLVDSVGGNHGTISGPVWSGNGLLYDGDEDRVTTSVASKLNSDAGTIIFRVTHGVDNHNNDYLLDTSGGNRFLLFFTGGSTLQLFTGGVNRGSSPNIAVTYSAGVTSTYALIWGVNELYVDGKLFHTFSAGGLATPNTTLFIGDRFTNPDQSFIGTIDDVKIYNRALSASEIQALDINPNLPILQFRPEMFSFVAAAPPTGAVGRLVNGGLIDNTLANRGLVA